MNYALNKFVIINRNDNRGGAAIASFRLMEALCRAGVDARMIVARKERDDERIAAVAARWPFYRERLDVWLKNGQRRDTLFLLDPATRGVDLACHPWVKEADAIVLGWINQGMLSIADINRLTALGKPLLWVMHDMWNCTGACHYTVDCERYKSTCTACPIIGRNGDDITTATQRRKQALYAQAPIRFVAVSHALAERCRESSLMRNCDITVIANPFPAHEYRWEYLGDDSDDELVLAMGAARLDDPVKGLDTLRDALTLVERHSPALFSRLRLLLFGGIRDKSLLDTLPCRHEYLGMVANPNDVLRRAHVVLSASRFESFGYTLVEGMASGCLAVTTGNGGQRDIVTHRANGYIADDAQGIADGIAWADDARHRITRRQQHDDIAARFGYPAIAARFLELAGR